MRRRHGLVVPATAFPDPLGEADVTEAYKVWGLPPIYDDEDGGGDAVGP